MFINLSEIMSVKGKVQCIEVPIELENFHLNGVDYKVICKEFAKLTISSVGERKVHLEGNANLILIIPCSRCLQEVETVFHLSVCKNLDFRQTEEDRRKELDETNYIEGTNLDVDLLFYDEIFMEFPLKVLCKEDCRGLCFICGGNLNDKECSCDRVIGDPRMSAIRDIFKLH